MTSDRPYHRALSPEGAETELRSVLGHPVGPVGGQRAPRDPPSSRRVRARPGEGARRRVADHACHRDALTDSRSTGNPGLPSPGSSVIMAVMCDHCMEHGAGGKWYLNAERYSNEIVEKYNLREFLLEQYTNFEQMSVRKVDGFSPVGMDHTFRMPIIGRVVKTHGRAHAAQPEAAHQPVPARGAHRPGGPPGGRRGHPASTAPPSPSSRRTACAAT